MVTIVSVRVHVLGADPTMAPHTPAITESAKAALARITKLLPVSDVDVVVARNPFAVIPELGIGGNSPSAHLVQIAVDPAHERFRDALDIHLSRTLAHELHHCARWLGPGYGSTLGEALVSEGLADHFDLEAHPGARPYHWTQALDAHALNEVWNIAKSHLWEADYDHTHWFFNTSEAGPPFHAGYALGFQLVQEYLNTNPGRRPSELAAVSAHQIL